MLNRKRTQISNAIRAQIGEFGMVALVGRLGVERLLQVVEDQGDNGIAEGARVCLKMLAAQFTVVEQQLRENGRRVVWTVRGGQSLLAG